MAETIAKLHHIDCQISDCEICLNDHLDLQHYLITKTNEPLVDHLGKYHKWLSDNGVEPETIHGWGTQEAFDPDNIRAYIKSRNG